MPLYKAKFCEDGIFAEFKMAKIFIEIYLHIEMYPITCIDFNKFPMVIFGESNLHLLQKRIYSEL